MWEISLRTEEFLEESKKVSLIINDATGAPQANKTSYKIILIVFLESSRPLGGLIWAEKKFQRKKIPHAA